MRVRIHRGMKAILNKESKVSESNSFVNPEFKPGSSIITNGILNTQWRSDFVKDIRKWALDFNITKRAVRACSRLCTQKECISSPRTLELFSKLPDPSRLFQLLEAIIGTMGCENVSKKYFQTSTKTFQLKSILTSMASHYLKVLKLNFGRYWPIYMACVK